MFQKNKNENTITSSHIIFHSHQIKMIIKIILKV